MRNCGKWLIINGRYRAAQQRVSVLIVLLWITSFSMQAQVGRLPAELVERLAASVVMILNVQNGEVVGQGTGTIISSDGLIYTNDHVIEGGDDYVIAVLEDQNEQPVPTYYASLTFTAADLGLDFAILRIDADIDGKPLAPGSLNLPFVPTADADTTTPIRSDRVFILGYPGVGDGFLVLTSGTITTIQNGDVCEQRMPVWYQTDAEISPGNSGGLAVNQDGVPIGIPTAVNSEDVTGGRLGGILPFNAIRTATTATDCNINSPSTIDNITPDMPLDEDKRPFTNFAFACGDARTENGAQIIVVQMRSGSIYEATVIGLGGFDPVLQVSLVDFDTGGDTPLDCNDDSSRAADYQIELPEIGTAFGSNTDANLRFSQNTGRAFANIGLTVGGYDSAKGEFLLILEGMAVTRSDNGGDPFVIPITQSILNAGELLQVYMIGADSQLDPFAGAVDLDYDLQNPVYVEVDGVDLFCDDAGQSDRCFGRTQKLERSSIVAGNNRLFADEYDAMLAIPPDRFINAHTSLPFLLFSSYNRETTGNYTLVFHIAID